MSYPIHMLPWREQGRGRHALLVAVAGLLLLVLLAIFGGETFQIAAVRCSTASIGVVSLLVSLRARVPSRMRVDDAADLPRVEGWLVRQGYVRKGDAWIPSRLSWLHGGVHEIRCRDGEIAGPASVLRLVRWMLEKARRAPPP